MNRLVARPEGFSMTGYRSRAAGYVALRKGLLPPTIPIGKHVFFPADELARIVNARIAGADDEAIKALVADMVKARKVVA